RRGVRRRGRRGDAGWRGGRWAKAQPAAGDPEAVAAAVEHAVERDARAKVGQAAAGQDGQAGAVGPGEPREVRADRRREEGGAGRGDKRGQGPAEVEDHDTPGPLPDLPAERAGETPRKTPHACATRFMPAWSEVTIQKSAWR